VALALAAISLLLPWQPVFDPWAWLVWAREGLGLDTSGGPSWKPLPVIVDAPLILAGEAAPELWLLVSRTGWLLGPILGFVLAARLRRDREPADRSGALAAAAIAAAGIVAFEDPLTPWLRQLAGGLGEPILVALTLAAALLAIDRRPGAAWACAVAAGLLRPEAWPLLAVGGIWLWRNEARLRPAVAGAALALPLLWFVPDLLASGDVLTGIDRAAAPDGGLSRLPGAFLDGILLAPAGLLIAAGLGLRAELRSRETGRTSLKPSHREDSGTFGAAGSDRTRLVLAAAALVWLATTLALTLLGFAGLARFFAPFAAIVCVLGAVALVELARAARARGDVRERVVVAGLCLLTALGLGWRLSQLPADARSSTAYARSVEDAFALVDRVGAERMLGCGRLATTDVQTQAALIWKLEAPLSRIDVVERRLPRSGLLLVGAGAPAGLRAGAEAGGDPLASAGTLSLYEISCSAGVGGSER
jgi:hypothetical protein